MLKIGYERTCVACGFEVGGALPSDIAETMRRQAQRKQHPSSGGMRL